jgi:hypothetical protein
MIAYDKENLNARQAVDTALILIKNNWKNLKPVIHD